MGKKLEQAAFLAGFLAMATLGTPATAQLKDYDEPELPAAEPATAAQLADYCSDASRWFRREMAKTDGDTNPPQQTEAECHQLFGVVDNAERAEQKSGD